MALTPIIYTLYSVKHLNKPVCYHTIVINKPHPESNFTKSVSAFTQFPSLVDFTMGLAGLH